MPKAFEDCVSGGGRVRTVSGPSKRFGLKTGQFMRICFSGGEMHRGEKETKSTAKADAISKGSR